METICLKLNYLPVHRGLITRKILELVSELGPDVNLDSMTMGSSTTTTTTSTNTEVSLDKPAPVKVKDPKLFNANKRWTPEEEARLVTSFQQGDTLSQLALSHGRSAGALSIRLRSYIEKLLETTPVDTIVQEFSRNSEAFHKILVDSPIHKYFTPL